MVSESDSDPALEAAPLRRPSKIESIEVVGRRWFQRGPGNTYHSVRIYVNDSFVYMICFAYGYGDGYQESAAEWLEANGYLERERYNNGSKETLWRACERLRIKLARTVLDVPRKKDLMAL
jgi:hypothetical protein